MTLVWNNLNKGSCRLDPYSKVNSEKLESTPGFFEILQEKTKQKVFEPVRSATAKKGRKEEVTLKGSLLLHSFH